MVKYYQGSSVTAETSSLKGVWNGKKKIRALMPFVLFESCGPSCVLFFLKWLRCLKSGLLFSSDDLGFTKAWMRDFYSELFLCFALFVTHNDINI